MVLLRRLLPQVTRPMPRTVHPFGAPLVPDFDTYRGLVAACASPALAAQDVDRLAHYGWAVGAPAVDAARMELRGLAAPRPVSAAQGLDAEAYVRRVRDSVRASGRRVARRDGAGRVVVTELTEADVQRLARRGLRDGLAPERAARLDLRGGPCGRARRKNP